MSPENKPQTLPLAGLRIIEVSSFVAAPLAGMTLGSLGAEVIRVDPIGGAADYKRWPVTEDGESIYWANLNQGKRSVAANFRDPEATALIRELILEAGIVVTNAAGREWLEYDNLVKDRPDLIHVQVLGRADGRGALDYTVNAAMGFPLVTGPTALGSPVNHVLPAWDVACGLYAALSVTAAVHRRASTGEGAKIVLPLEDVALATVGHLGYLAEVQLGGPDRPRVGNFVYGTYGSDFRTADGETIMVVAVTPRHFRDLAKVTATADAIAALETALGVDFSNDGDRFRHREVLSGLFSTWFRDRTIDQVEKELSTTAVVYERYRTFAQIAADPRVTDNPMFGQVDQPRIGSYLAPTTPMSIDGRYPAPRPAPANGDDSATVLSECLGLSEKAIADLEARGAIRVSTPATEKEPK